MDDSGDRFVAKRGAQGEDWHWESEVPPEPGDSDGGLRRVLSRVSGWFASNVRSPVWAGFAAVREFFNTPYRPPEPPPSDAKTPAIGPEALSEASQEGADTESPSLGPIATTERPRTLGSVIKWSRIVPRMPGARPKEAVAWSKAGERPKAAIYAPRPSAVPQDSGSLMMLLASIGLAAAIVIGVIIAAEAIGGGDGDNGLVAEVTETPKTTLIPPASETPDATETPLPTPGASPTATPNVTPGPATAPATPARTPVRTATPRPPTPPLPQGAVAAAFWANSSDSWWFGAVSGSAARYEEGQEVPLLVQWEGAAGQTYQVRITYDCAAAGVLGAIDYLSGTQSWGRSIVYAKYGPAKEQPDAAVLAPDTSGFIPDDQNAGVISLYGGKFPVLPDAPSPSGACSGKRTVSLPVQANGGKVTVLVSGHLGAASTYGPGKGAAGATSALTVIASVDGVGTASTSIDPSAIADVEH